jgi:hypothetical protein
LDGGGRLPQYKTEQNLAAAKTWAFFHQLLVSQVSELKDVAFCVSTVKCVNKVAISLLFGPNKDLFIEDDFCHVSEV